MKLHRIEQNHRRTPAAMIGRQRSSHVAFIFSLGVLGIFSLAAITGCEKHSTVPTHPSEESHNTSDTGVNHPTTQALVDGPRKPLNLGGMPITIHVPESWQIETLGDVDPPLIELVGATPHGDVRIHLSVLPPHPAMAMDALCQDLEKQRHDHPDTVLVGDVRRVKPLVILDRQDLNPYLPSTAPSTKTATAPARLHTVSWEVTIFNPIEDGKKYQVELLSCVSMDRELYEKDKDFLEKIFASIEYNPLAGM